MTIFKYAWTKIYIINVSVTKCIWKQSLKWLRRDLGGCFKHLKCKHLVVRHRLQANNIRSQYQLDIEANSHDQVLQDVALVAGNVWPPPRVYLSQVATPEDDAYLELLNLDAKSYIVSVIYVNWHSLAQAYFLCKH